MERRYESDSLQTEIFVYDRQYVSDPGDVQLPELPRPASLQSTNPPASITDQNDVHSWRNLFMERRDWALDLAAKCGVIEKTAREHNERTEVIHRGVGVALENLKSHVGSLEHRFQGAQKSANTLVEKQQAALDGLQRALATLESIPARKDFPLLGRPSTPKKDKDRPTGTLKDFVDVPEVERAEPEAAIVLSRFSNHVQEIEKIVINIAAETQKLVDEVLPGLKDGDEGLLEEVETIAKKIGSDYEHVLGLPNNQKMLATISRLALSHTQDLLPSLLEISTDIQHIMEEAWRCRGDAEKAALQQMRTISIIESRLADANSQLLDLDMDSNAFDVIYSVFDMPTVYGSILIESIRRHEWSNKIKTDSLSLAEEMAVLTDEEQRRRKKWVKSMGDSISFVDTTAPGIEVNLQGQDDGWPEVNRKEIELYIDEIRTKHSLSTIADGLSVQLKDLDAPTRQQRRRAKAFKHGSVFDIGRSSLLLRGDDMVRSLQEEKTKLEERVKGSDSRIRKLEDLLHRQSHLSRPASGNFGPEFPSSPASPHPETMSRRSSVSSRRVSMTQSPEDRVLVQRIVALEAELATERDTVQRLQKEAYFERQTSSDKYQEAQSRYHEAQSTKEDLVSNLEARQREFEDERRDLESELKKYRHRNEEIEEELDRLIDGRHHDRQDLDERIHQLELDLQSAQTKSVEEAQKAIELNGLIQAQQEKEQELQAKINSLEICQRERDERDQDNYSALQSAFMNLSPGGAVPSEFPTLIKAVDILSEGLAIHAKNTEESSSKAMADLKLLEEKNSQLESDLEQGTKRLEGKEAEISRLAHEMSDTRSRLESIEFELERERSAMSSLQNEISAGESGSNALLERIAEEEQKHETLSQKLAKAEAETQGLKDAQSEWEKSFERATTRYNSQGARSYDISKQLHLQVETLVQMLEQMGFALTQQDGHLAVQRASKVNASSSLAESFTKPGIASVKPDESLLAWMQADTLEEEETRFVAFMENLSCFSFSNFGDAIVKRVKDLETYARKYLKESRTYRDRYHRAQSEAHEKIAYRSFKEGDLALFLPTRNQAIRSWAAFNINAPHNFLREQDSHKLDTRDWLLARITKIEERVVDLSKSLNSAVADRTSLGYASDGASLEDDNPFELSDGLRWYLIDAVEEKPGAPATPGISKSTVASAHVDAKGSIRLKRPTEESTVAQTLSKSLDSRRNSSNSKRGTPTPSHKANDSASDIIRPVDADTGSQPREAAPLFDEVRRGLLRDP